jgi:hypothetical protein
MPTTTFKGLIGVAAMAVTLSAHAQNSTSTEGTGVLVEANRVSNLRRATVNMDRSGNLRIELESERGRVRLEGTWDDDRDDRYRIALWPAGGRNIRMEGTIDMDANGRIRQIYADAASNNERWMLNFRGNGNSQGGGWGGNTGGWGDDNWDNGDWGDNGWGNQMFDLRVAADGEGQFNFGREASRPDRVSVDFRRDGRVFVVFDGDRQYTLVGRYNTQGNTQNITFEVFDGLGRRNVNGRGTITLSPDRRQLQRVNASGTADGQRYSLSFSSGMGMRDEWVYGRGNYTIGRYRGEANTVRVMLNQNGRFTIRLDGDRSYEWNGDWRSAGNTIQLTVDDVRNSDWAEGRGTIVIDRNTNRVQSLQLNGRADNEQFNLNIRADEQWWRENEERGRGQGRGQGRGNGNGGGRGNGNGNGNGGR